MKKSVVLFITLLFITLISILIIQNLKDTDKLVNDLNYDNALSQIQITISDVQREVLKYFKNKSEEDIDIILENTSMIPLSFGNVNISLSIEDYEVPPFNLNKLTLEDKQDDLYINNINYKYDFETIVNRSKVKNVDKYTNQNQVYETIEEYIRTTKDQEILNIKDKFTFIDDINNSIRFIKCSYSIDVESIKADVYFIFDSNNTGVKDFDILNIY
jgi:hypothetical protein